MTRGEVLVGRADDATGRSATVAPRGDLVRAWAAPAPRDGAPSGAAVRVTPVGRDALAVGDRVLSLVDAAVLGPAGRLGDVGGRVSPDGLVAALDDDDLVLVDPRRGVVVESVALVGERPTRGERRGLRRTEVAGWAGDTVVLRTWDGGLGSSTSWGVDRASGRVRWRSFVDAYAPVGDGWFLGLAAGGLVLVDGRDGDVHAPPAGIAESLLGEPVVVAGVAHAATVEGLVAWSVEDARVTGRGPAAVPAGVVPAAAQQRVGFVAVAGGRSVATTAPGLGVLGDVVVSATRTGVRGDRRDGTSWERPLPGLHGMVVQPDAGVVVAVVAGDGGADLGAVVLDAAGRPVLETPVRSVGAAPARVRAVVGDRVVVDDPAAPGGQRVLRAADGGREDGRDAPADRTVTGDGDGADAARGSRVLGLHPRVASRSSGTIGPVVWRARDGVLLGAGVPVVDGARRDGSTPVLTPTSVAVPTDDGTTLVVLPAAAEVTAPVRLAVGAQDLGAAPPTSDLRRVPGLVPAASAGGVLLAVPEAGDERLLHGVDPTSGRVLWRGEAPVGPDWPVAAGTGRSLPAAAVVGVAPAGAAVAGRDTPVVVLDGAALLAVAPRDGRVLWSRDLGDRVASDAVVLDDAVVVALPTELLVLDVATGVVRRSLAVGDLVTALTGAGGTVVAGTAGGAVVVLDGASGEEVTSVDVGGVGDVGDVGVADVAVVARGLVVVLDDRSVEAHVPSSQALRDPDVVEVP